MIWARPGGLAQEPPRPERQDERPLSGLQQPQQGAFEPICGSSSPPAAWRRPGGDRRGLAQLAQNEFFTSKTTIVPLDVIVEVQS